MLDLEGEYVPGGQYSQPVLSSFDLFPSIQVEQEDHPSCEYIPGSHLKHYLALEDEYVPAGQLSHPDLSLLTIFPSTQVLQ